MLSKKYLITLAITLPLLTVVLAFLFLKPKIPGVKSEVKPRLIRSSKLEVEADKALIVTFRVKPKTQAQIINTQRTSLHLPPVLDTQPPNSNSTYVFKTTLYNQDGKMVYSTWRAFPIQKKSDGSFEISLVCPDQPGTILVVTDVTGSQLVSTPI